MDTKKIITIITLTLVIVAVCASILFFLFLSPKKPTEQISVVGPTYDELVIKNQDFAEAEALLRERKTEQAIPLFETALRNTTDPSEEAHIKYSLALAYSSTRKNTGYYRNSISLVKEIIENNEYSPSIKSLSVNILDRLLVSSVAEEAAALIANSTPYSDFFTDSNIHNLRKNLLSFGVSFYPIADLEMKLAALHAADLLNLSKEESTEERQQEIELKKNYIKNAVEKGDADILERISKVPRLAVYAPEALLYKAITADRYFQATNEKPFGDVGDLYKAALTSAEQNYRPQLPFIEYHYTTFLAREGKTENEDIIKSLLAQYGKPDAKYAYMAGVFVKEKNNILGEKQNLLLLAQIDSQFKAYLESLGWEQKDFLQ